MTRAEPRSSTARPDPAALPVCTAEQVLIDTVHRDAALLSAFRSGWGRESVAAYLDEYRHIPDIVQRLAGDLGVALPS